MDDLSKSAFGSKAHREMSYIDSGFYKVGDLLAKEIGFFFYVKHLARTRMKVIYLIIKLRLRK